MKIQSNFKNFTIKMISAKSSTNSESFIRFGRGRRMAWRLPMDTPIYNHCGINELVFNMLCWNRSIEESGE